MAKAQRTKGATGEREIVKAFTLRGWTAERNLSQSRDGGYDVAVSQPGLAKPSWTIEVKRRKALAVRKFLDQVSTARVPGSRAAVIMREDGRTDWMVLMDLPTFLDTLADSRTMGYPIGRDGHAEEEHY